MHLRRRTPTRVVALFVVAAVTAIWGSPVDATALPPPGNADAPATIMTPGDDMPNPFVLFERGRYYLYASEQSISSPNIQVRVSTDREHWGPISDALPNLPSWAVKAFTWAPDVRKINRRYVMYFTALLRDHAPNTQCIGSATSNTPEGPFVPAAETLVCQLDHRGSIDPRTFVDAGGALWLHWKSDDNADVEGTTHSFLYAQRLSRDGLHFVGSPSVILTADQPWEGRIVEAPQMIRANGKYWLFYSGNWFNSANYAIGVAQCSGPAGPCRKPFSSPFLSSNAQGSGPGESSLFHDRDGWWIVYGPWAQQYSTPTPRPVALAPVAFDDRGPYVSEPPAP